jgi:hypothetical protein
MMTFVPFLIFCAVPGANRVQRPAEPQKTVVIIVGTTHQAHLKNPKYSPEVLRDLVLSLKPDAILVELPSSLFDSDGRPSKDLRSRDGCCPENWASDDVAVKSGIKQVSFDRADRQENFEKTKYFERQKRSSDNIGRWEAEIRKNAPQSADLRVLQSSDLAQQAENELFRMAGPEIINSEAFDAIIRVRKLLDGEVLPSVLDKYENYKEAASDLRFLADEWRERNQIMVQNILNAAQAYPGKRLCVLTGCEHRYILRELLKGMQSIELKEYWELAGAPVS